jgi:hypothetical protein
VAFPEAQRLVGLRELHLEDSACSSLPIDVSASVSYLISVIFNFSDWVSCWAALFASVVLKRRLLAQYGMRRRGDPMVYGQHYLRRKYTGFMYFMEL